MDYFLMSYKLKANNFSLYKLSNSKIILSKNENGTYSEFNDYEITIAINETDGTILSFDIKYNVDKTECKSIEKILDNAVTNNIKFEELCEQLCKF